jgi:hypothetical protein
MLIKQRVVLPTLVVKLEALAAVVLWFGNECWQVLR